MGKGCPKYGGWGYTFALVWGEKMDKEEVLRALKSLRVGPTKVKRLAQMLRIPKEKYVEFKWALAELAREGRIMRFPRNRYTAVQLPRDLVTGRVDMVRSGAAFVIPDDRSRWAQDIYVRRSDLRGAMDGDRVLVRVRGGRGGAPRGVVEKIIERRTDKVVGRLVRRGKRFFVELQGVRRLLAVPKALLGGARLGQKVVAELPQESTKRGLLGRVVEVLGDEGEPEVEERALLLEFGVDEEVPQEAIDEEEHLLGVDWSARWGERKDLTGLLTVTIDPKQAYDFDDAISVVREGENWRLYVHIADVSFFVRAGGAVDRLARRRLNSVYLPGRVVPMLPERITHTLCCLMEGQTRPAKTVEMEVDPKGVVRRSRVYRSIIRNDARLTYEAAQEMLEGRGSDAVAKMLRLAGELADLLRRVRLRRGALDMEIPEPRVIMERGTVVDIIAPPRLKSHILIEDFMLLANEAVARFLARKGVAFIRRVHEEPDERELRRFRSFALSLGLKLRSIKPADIQKLLGHVAGTPFEFPVNYALLRSLKKAVYTTQPSPHYGLALEDYTHFTSPIRRYVDLTVHRALDALFDGVEFVSETELESVARDATESEIRTDRLEREFLKLKACYLMRHRIGQVFDAVIVGVDEGIMWVLLERPAVEGVVPERVFDEGVRFDPSTYSLLLRRTNRVFRVGQRIKVRLLSVDVGERSLLFCPL